MNKEYLYDILSSLENTSAKEPDFWKSVAYLSFCNEALLQHADPIFTERLMALIDSHSTEDDERNMPECYCGNENNNEVLRNDFNRYRGFVKYAIAPEGPEERQINDLIPFPSILALNALDELTNN